MILANIPPEKVKKEPALVGASNSNNKKHTFSWRPWTKIQLHHNKLLRFNRGIIDKHNPLLLTLSLAPPVLSLCCCCLRLLLLLLSPCSEKIDHVFCAICLLCDISHQFDLAETCTLVRVKRSLKYEFGAFLVYREKNHALFLFASSVSHREGSIVVCRHHKIS